MPEGDDIVIEGMLVEEGVDPVFGKWKAGRPSAEELKQGRSLRVGQKGGPLLESKPVREIGSDELASIRATDEYKRFFQANMKRLKGVEALPALPNWSFETHAITPGVLEGASVAKDPKWGWDPYSEGFVDSAQERVRKIALVEALAGEYARRGMSQEVADWRDALQVYDYDTP